MKENLKQVLNQKMKDNLGESKKVRNREKNKFE